MTEKSGPISSDFEAIQNANLQKALKLQEAETFALQNGLGRTVWEAWESIQIGRYNPKQPGPRHLITLMTQAGFAYCTLDPDSVSSLHLPLDRFSDLYCLEVLRRCHGNKSLAARRLGIGRQTLLQVIGRLRKEWRTNYWLHTLETPTQTKATG